MLTNVVEDKGKCPLCSHPNDATAYKLYMVSK